MLHTSLAAVGVLSGSKFDEGIRGLFVAENGAITTRLRISASSFG